MVPFGDMASALGAVLVLYDRLQSCRHVWIGGRSTAAKPHQLKLYLEAQSSYLVCKQLTLCSEYHTSNASGMGRVCAYLGEGNTM